MYKTVILLLLWFLNFEIECCRPENFKYFKVTEKLTRAPPKTNAAWKEASYYGIRLIDNHPLIIANEELPGCREKANIEEYERHLQDADIIEIRLHNIPVLRTGDVQNLNIVSLQLQDNNIERIEPGAFINLSKLKSLNLANNQLTIFDPKWFTNTPELKILLLRYNQLKNIPDDSFEPFKGTLEIVDLSYNQIEDIHYSLIKNMPELRSINLTHNKIKCLNGDVLKGFRGGTELLIVGNEGMGCACLTKIQKFALENSSLSETTMNILDRYIPAICNAEIVEALENTLKRISALESKP